jgi:hypothetical protein
VALPYPYLPFPVSITSDNISQVEQEVIALGYGYAFTNQYGQYDITGLVPGMYVEFVLKAGYEPAWRYDVVVSSGKETVEDFQLQPLLAATMVK